MPRPSLAAAPLVGLAGGPVAPLVVGKGHELEPPASSPPLALLPLQAQQVQGTAHLLHRHLRVFPPATAECARPRTTASAGTTPGASSGPCSPCLRSASSRSRPWPRGRCAPRSSGGRPLAPA